MIPNCLNMRSLRLFRDGYVKMPKNRGKISMIFCRRKPRKIRQKHVKKRPKSIWLSTFSPPRNDGEKIRKKGVIGPNDEH